VTTESSKQISGSGGNRGAITTRRCGLLDSCDREDDAVPLSSDYVWADLIEIEDNTRDVRGSAVLRGADLTHTVGMNGDVPGVVEANCAREVQ
jgi:hypothetical protein